MVLVTLRLVHDTRLPCLNIPASIVWLLHESNSPDCKAKGAAMAIIDVVKWNATDEVYVWKFPSEELSTWTQLIVSESQEAIFVKEGMMLGPFPAGHHVLDTKNYPVLSKFVKIPFGGKSPFTAEVWFINKAIPLDVKWGTTDPIQLQDPKYDVMVPVRSFGQFGVQITDSKRFLHKLVGTMHTFDREKLVSYFRGLILTRVKSAISDTIVHEGISVLEISTRLNILSETLQHIMQPELAQYGLELKSFFVNSINVPEDDPAVSQLKAALAKRAEMNIIGYNYQQERTFNTLEKASGNTGGAAGAMNAGIGMAMGVGVGQTLGNALAQNTQSIMSQNDNADAPPIPAPSPPCPNCGKKTRHGDLFCTDCGVAIYQPLLHCPQCNKPGNGKYCPNCGASYFPSCKRCNAQLPGAVKFCPECGTPTANQTQG